MKKEWYQTSELIDIFGLPSTTQGVNRKARAENWLKRKPEGVQGRAFEYHISSLPKQVQETLCGMPKSQPAPLVQHNLIQIPFYEIYASAGHGVLPIEQQEPEYTIDLHPQLLINNGISPVNLISMPVKGDSMEPTLFDGDIVVVRKTSPSASVLEGVFVIRIGEEVFIKRIQYNRFEGRMQVDSDNGFYAGYVIKAEHLNEVQIIGEAVYVLSKLRKLNSYVSEHVAC
ncbi:helix-turn-helix domain-containing protein [Vibrio scophthalmi]|uniref:HTH Mu-type domain-containing protein n=1 Tax=Vibrio scophthalmi LMG 19158 TaxID=870967 RepID=F9RKE9_9VIBR|nr:LexA family transcriptional regulator [Vibrio scophthalmi]EGU39860.1 hypothetical protein VIS19158_09313 [Vibrio scophthalmi LMG 19158]